MDRNLTKCKDRTFIILICKPSNNPHLEYSNRSNAAICSKIKNDGEDARRGKRGKIFLQLGLTLK